MERKRPDSQLAPFSVTDTSYSAPSKKPKLTLKPPNFITAAKTKPSYYFDSFLEHVLELETSEEVLEQLLWFNDVRVAAGPQATTVKSAEECVSALKKLWRDYSEDSPVCNVLIRLFAILVNVADEKVSESMEEFALSTVKHGVCVYVLGCYSCNTH